MDAEIKNVLCNVQEVSRYLWENGWAERNGGNISVNLTEEYKGIDIQSSEYKNTDYQQLDMMLAEMTFFVSGTGLRIRDLAKDINSLKENSCILKINDKANGYYIIWGGLKENFKPTSELISHLNIHLDLIKRNTGYKAVVHTHPCELISLTHSSEHCKSSEQVNSNLWRMLPEVRLFVPRGVGLVPYTLPGSEELATLTVKILRDYDIALWEKHGALAAGEDLLEAFDFIDVANKGAKIFLQCLSAGFMPTGLSDSQMNEIENVFKLKT